MQPYTDLTSAGKLRRLHNLALVVITHYDLDHPEITYHGFDTNLLYRVTSASGERFMLRLAYPGWRTLQDLQSEAMWLNALRHDTHIPAPAVIPATSGLDVLPVSLPGIPQTWNATLMSWIPGRLLGRYLTAPNLSKMGELFAALHAHGAVWQPPPEFTARRFEHWLSRDEPNSLVSDPPCATLSAEVSKLPSAWLDLLLHLHDHVESAYTAIDRRDLRVIHCDLWHDNIKLHHGVLHPFDFEDTVWGYRCHDIAMAMLDLLETVGDERYPGLLAAFRQGYTVHLPWPDDPIEPFQAGRLLWKINWMANHQPQRLASIVERHIPVFEYYIFNRAGDLPAAGVKCLHNRRLEALYNLVYPEEDNLEPGSQELVVLGEQEAGTRHLRGSRPSIPTSLTPFFQEYDLAQLDLDRSAGTIIPRVLEFGDKEEIRWLFSIYPRQDISDWVHRWGGIALREPHHTFWLLVLGIGEAQR